MLDQLDGYPESIKFLRKNHNSTKKAPLLSDIINCEENYKISIETFLEPFLGYFVADDSYHAWEAIEMLNEAAKGRANFFVLDTLKNYQLPLNENRDACVRALDVMDIEEKYKKLFELLLGHVFIMEEAKQVQKINLESDQSVVILSKNDSVTMSSSKNCSISGNTAKMFTSHTLSLCLIFLKNLISVYSIFLSALIV